MECFQTASNLATGYSKSQKEKSSNSKYAMWAAEQIIDKYQVNITGTGFDSIIGDEKGKKCMLQYFL